MRLGFCKFYRIFNSVKFQVGSRFSKLRGAICLGCIHLIHFLRPGTKNQENYYNFHYEKYVRISLNCIFPYKDKHIMHEKDQMRLLRWYKVTGKRTGTNLSFFMKPFNCSKSLMKTANEYVKHVQMGQILHLLSCFHCRL